MSRQRRFAFVERTTTGAERLMLANFDGSLPFGGPRARIITRMDEVPGALPGGGLVPETYRAIAVAPDNAHVAVWSAQIGGDFVDYNIAIYDMTTGARSVRFNEHSVAGVNRANCSCPLFDAFLATEVANGVPPDQIALYDYSVVVEGTGIGQPTLVWSAAGTLIATYGFDVLVNGAGFALGRAPFAFEVAVTAPAGGGVTILSRNAGVAPYSPMPRNPFSVRVVSPRALPPGPEVIHFGKQPVTFHAPLWKKGLVRLLWPWIGTGYRTAKMVEGYV